MCYKTDKILKKNFEKETTFEKKIKKIKSTLQRNVTAGIRTCNHLHDARKQWRPLHEILGGRVPGALQDLYVRAMVGGSRGMLPWENFKI